MIDSEFITSGQINKIILSACHFKKLKEFEILIDYFDFYCERNKFTINLIPQKPALEKSIQLGFIRNQLQIQYDFYEEINSLSLSDLIDTFSCLGNETNPFVYKTSLNYPRYTLELPETVLEYLAINYFNLDALFKEEIEYLRYVFKEQFLDLSLLKSIVIEDNLTIFEFLQAKRIFNFFCLMFSKNIYKLNPSNQHDILRSLLPTIKETILINKMLGYTLSPEKAKTFLNLVTIQKSAGTIIDLQYHSLIRNGDYYILPLNIFVNSNTVRNLYSSEYKKNNENLLSNGEYDPVTEELVKAFEFQGFKTFKNIRYKSGEIDFIAVKKDFAFIAECKHSLNPTSLYELRTTYDYVKKANKQLNSFIEAIKNETVRSAFSKNTGVVLESLTTIKTAIVISNRMFSQFHLDHPIKSIHELRNIVETGKVRTDQGNFFLWKNGLFSIEDFMEYLNGKNKVVAIMNDALIDKIEEYRIDKYSFRRFTYSLDIYKVNNGIKDILPKLKAYT